jgi:hypothetical protein
MWENWVMQKQRRHLVRMMLLPLKNVREEKKNRENKEKKKKKKDLVRALAYIGSDTMKIK